MTPLRRWIKRTLLTELPIGTIWSDTSPARFNQLTGVTHEELLKKWFQIKKDGTPDFETKGYDPTFTTCSSFLPRFASRICQAGHIPVKSLRAFALNTEKGWTPGWLGDAVAGGPQEGDFFQLGSGGMTTHVGIIAQIHGTLWSKVAGGAGGRGSKHDGVKRTPLEGRPGGVMGWLDVDAYFAGWSGPDLGDI